MARSIHTTKRDLLRERRFAAVDEAADGINITELEVRHLKKDVLKTNETWKRQAGKAKAEIHAKIIYKSPVIERRVQRARGNTLV